MDAPFWAEINVPLLVALPFFLLFIGIEVYTLTHDDADPHEPVTSSATPAPASRWASGHSSRW